MINDSAIKLLKELNLPKPTRPFFGSGPCAKPIDWSLAKLDPLVARSHRSADGMQRIQDVLQKTRTVLEIPDDYHLAIVPGSATGAMAAAMWNLLGARPLDILAWDVFGYNWVEDVTTQLKLPNTRVMRAEIGKIPELTAIDAEHDVIFTWNGTTAGVCVPNGDWLPEQRQGLVICDAISAIGAVQLPWSRLDVVTFAWQKAFGGEAGHGMIVLSPRAYERLQTYKPAWPVPRLLRLRNDQGAMAGIFQAQTMNTVSLLLIEDYRFALEWAERMGGLRGLVQRTQQNAKVVYDWLAQSSWARPLPEMPATYSPTSICFTLKDPKFHAMPVDQQWQMMGAISKVLADLGVAYDTKNHARSIPSLRLWAGPTVETEDLQAVLPWIEAVAAMDGFQ